MNGGVMGGRCFLLLALQAFPAHGWSAQQQFRPVRYSFLRGIPALQLLEPEAAATGAATGAASEDIPKTDGIPNYMLRNKGTIARLAEDPESSTEVQEDGVLYAPDRLITILTSDVIDMVQQQGDGAEKVDYLGENILIEGMLFDDFQAEDTIDITSPDESVNDVVTLEIVGPEPSSALELGQLGDDDAKRQSIAEMLSFSSGFSGWSARVVVAGRVRAGFLVSKRAS